MIANGETDGIDDPFEVVRNELQRIKGSISEIQGMLLVDEDGMSVVSVMENDDNEELWATASAQFIDIGNTLVNDLNWEELDQCIIKAKNNLLVIQKCSSSLILICESSIKVNLAILFMQLKRVNRVIQKSLG